MTAVTDFTGSLGTAARNVTSLAGRLGTAGKTLFEGVRGPIEAVIATTAAGLAAANVSVATFVSSKEPLANTKGVYRGAKDSAQVSRETVPYVVTALLLSDYRYSPILLGLMVDPDDLSFANLQPDELLPRVAEEMKGLGQRLQALAGEAGDLLSGDTAGMRQALDAFMAQESVLNPATPLVVALKAVKRIFDAANRGAQGVERSVLDLHDKIIANTKGRLDYDDEDRSVSLDHAYKGVVAGTDCWAVLSYPGHERLYPVDRAMEVSRAQFGLSGKSTVVVLGGEEGMSAFVDKVRETSVYVVSDRIAIADGPDPSRVEGESVRVKLDAGGMTVGRTLIVAGRDAATNETAAEAVRVTAARASRGGTLIEFTPALAREYERASVHVHGNVARATHGETFAQVLGNGEGTRTFQSFKLAHAPLTHVYAETPEGTRSTLEVRVNDVQWQEARSLYGTGPDSRVFNTRADESGNVTVSFGDGKRGARPPSGQMNVRARYRKGLGTPGNVRAGALTQLASHPMGLTAVTNPIVASGGANAEGAREARRNIGLSVRTLGRAVSLTDYEDFARTFAGVSKAQARVLPLRGGNTIVITLAGPDGTSPGAPTIEKLTAALHRNGNPFVRVVAVAFRPATFRVALKVKTDADRERETVCKAVEAALRERFSFDARDFAQPVRRSELCEAIHRVPGVAAVDIDFLYRGPSARLDETVGADGATPDAAGSILGAELLLLAEGPFDALEAMA